jgi:hypothetical protein
MQRGYAFFQRHRAVREIADAQHGRFKPGFAQKSSFHGYKIPPDIYLYLTFRVRTSRTVADLPPGAASRRIVTYLQSAKQHALIRPL